MVEAQGDVWWADFGDPLGSSPGYRRPVVVVQNDGLNRSRIATILTVPLTRTLKWANAPGNVLLSEQDTGLPSISVANVSQLSAIPRERMIEAVGQIPRRKLEAIFMGIDIVLGR